jgi:hypothetical protein
VWVCLRLRLGGMGARLATTACVACVMGRGCEGCVGAMGVGWPWLHACVGVMGVGVAMGGEGPNARRDGRRAREGRARRRDGCWGR